MILSPDVLFIHVPKTGGMSLTEYLLENLPGEKIVTAPAGHTEQLPQVRVVVGKRHETLAEAVAVMRELGRALDSVQRIIAVVRNPYAIEVSYYHYLRLGHPWDRGALQDIAMSDDFDRFVQFVPYPSAGGGVPIETWYTLDGQMPEQMCILRLEHIRPDLARALDGIVDVPEQLPVTNATQHGDWRDYVNEQNEPIIFRKYEWLFRYYPRHAPRLGTPSASG